MANELLIKAQVVYNPSDGSLAGVDSGLLSKLLTITGEDFRVFTQEIGTSEEAIDIGDDIGTIGYVLLYNKGDNDVYIGFADVSSEDDARPVVVKSEEFALFRAQGTLYGRADTEASQVRIYAFEE